MSGGLKSIGKVFKKVVKVVKKIALPALAIGAVALTGGAALGVLPGLGSLGLSPALTGILSTAGKGALTGALGAAVTGKNILKGATGGALVGGALGGVGALTGGIGNVGTAAAGGASAAAATGATAASGALATGISGATAAGGSGLLGGIGGFINRNPTIVGNLLDGVGSGLIAAQADKETKRQEAQERANFGGFAGSPNFAIGAPQASGEATPPSSTGRPFIEFDPKLGRLVTRGG